MGRYLEGRRSYSPCWHPREYTEAKELEVQKAIVKKTDDFAKPGYQKFDQNWLLIMDRKPFHFADIDELLENVRGSISWGTIKFDALFFVTQVRNRALKKNEEALCQLSESHCQVIGRVAGG